MIHIWDVAAGSATFGQELATLPRHTDTVVSLAFSPDGFLYVVSFENDKVLQYDAETGNFLGELLNDFLNGPPWLAVRCGPFAISEAPQASPRVIAMQVEPGMPNPDSRHSSE